MRTYENKDELKNEINKSFAKYISEFNDIPEHLKDKRIDEVDRTPAENLAYQVGWTTLVIKWESDERKGIPVKTPSDNFKWNQLGELYQWFTDTYAQLSLQELKDRLNENINSIYAMIDSLSDEELFKPHMRKWADEATKQLSGKYTNSYMLIQLLRSEPLEPRLENGKRLHYNFQFVGILIICEKPVRSRNKAKPIRRRAVLDGTDAANCTMIQQRT